MKYVALLRGINVGGNNKVVMSDLRAAFTQMGFSNVITYINSGTVLFEALEKPDILIVNTKLLSHFGFYIPTLIVRGDYICNLVALIPSDWTNDDMQKTDVGFLWSEIDNPDITKSLAMINLITTIYSPGALVWNVLRVNQQKSKLDTLIRHPYYQKMTVRNINTVRKLVEILSIS
jgi:uncharacterized protein (DUF1697 family)